MRQVLCTIDPFGRPRAVLGYATPAGEVKSTLYMCRKVLNAEGIIAWAKGVGFDTVLPPEEMHVTQAYSTTPVVWAEMGDSYPSLAVLGGPGRSLGPLGDDGALVLKFRSPEMTARWAELLQKGASWKYEDYTPHITLTYTNPAGIDPSTIIPYQGVIELGPEIFQPVKVKWAEGIKEMSQDGQADFSELTVRLDRLEGRAHAGLRDALEECRDALAARIRNTKDLERLAKELTLPRRSLVLQEARAMVERAWDEGQRAARREVRLGKRTYAEDGVWRTINGRRVFIRSGESAEDALKRDIAEQGADGKGKDGVSVLDRMPRYTISGRPSKDGQYIRNPFYEEEGAGDVDGMKLSRVDFERADVVHVATGKLVSVQDQVKAVKVSAILSSGFDAKAAGELYVVKHGGRFWIWDGNHRAVAAKLSGVGSIAARVVEGVGTHSYASSFVPKLAVKWLRSAAFYITDLISTKVLGEAKGIILNGLKTGKPASVMIEELVDVFLPYLGDPTTIRNDKLIEPHRLETIVRTNTTAAYNHGRLTQFLDKDVIPFLKGVRYSAIMDSRTTEVCQHLHGKVFKPRSPDLEALLPPNHYNCRSIILPVVAGEVIKESEFITPSEIGKALELADAKFLSEQQDAVEYKDWDESKVERHPRGAPASQGGEFAPKGTAKLSRNENGIWVDEDGKPADDEDQGRLKALGVPPAWKDVQLNPDADAPLQATGLDSKGRKQYKYSTAHSEAASAQKFERLRAFHKEVPKVLARVRADLKDPKFTGSQREAAEALNLIARTGLRPGSDTETGAKVKAYGATTLLAEHVKVSGSTVEFDFVGKKGVRIQKQVEDKELAKSLAPRVARGGRMFQTTDAQVRDYLHSRDGDFKVKDFRTWHGTSVALRELKKYPEPTSAKEFAKVQREVSKVVAAHLGNTPTIAKAAYIDPAVWTKWGK